MAASSSESKAGAIRSLFSRVLNLIWLGNLLLLTAYTLNNVLIPFSVQKAGYGEATNGLIMGMSSLGSLLSLLSMGMVIDRSDPRRVFCQIWLKS